MSLDPGTRTMTAPGVLGTSSGSGDLYPLRVFFASLVASSGTDGVLRFYNGKAASGTICGQARAEGLSSDTWECGYGLLFTSGCYVDMTTGSMHVAIQFQVEPA